MIQFSSDIRKNIDGISIHLQDMHTYDFNCNNCVNIGYSSGGVTLKTNNIGTRLHIRFSGKIAGIIGFGGTCGVKIDDLNLQGTVAVGEANGRPTAKAQNLNVALNDFDLGCSGAVGAVINLLKDLFKSEIVAAFDNVAKGAIANAINGQLDKTLQGLNLDFPINYNFATMEFDLTGPPSFGSSMIVPVKGVLVPNANKGIVFPFNAPSSLPTSCPGMIGVQLSAYSLRTAAYTFWKGGHLRTTLPDAVPVKDVALLIPGFPKAVGANTSLSVTLAVNATPEVTTSASGLTIVAQTSLELSHNNSRAVFSFSPEVSFGATATNKGG
eukprot:gene25414-1686_t